MSESERADRLDPARALSVEDIRALAGPATPHFALQIRNRIQRLAERLPTDDPVRVEAAAQIDRLTELARNTGEPRGPGPVPRSRRSG